MTRPEFDLTIACCRSNFSGGSADRLGRLASSVDWAEFARLVQRHRVESLVNSALKKNDVPRPAEIDEALSTDARTNAERNLRAAAECKRIAEGFSDAGVDLLFVKGLTLSALAYGDPFLKMSIDIDILVERSALAEAATLLQAMGYRAVIPPADANSAELSKWHKRRKESVWTHAGNGLVVDLHTALADTPALIPAIGMTSPRQTVPVTSQWSFSTLAQDELLAYLCVHGAWSSWYRIKWITDIAALVYRGGDGAAERMYERARSLGAGRAPAQALLLADKLFRIHLSPELRAELESNRLNAMLASASLRELQQDRSPAERRLGTLPLHLIRPFLVSGWRSKFSEIKRQLQDVVQHATLPA
jgi:hypothetical protein